MPPKNFGIDTTAMSNATGPLQQGPDLASLLGSISAQPAMEANQLQGAIGDLQGQQPPNVLQRLLGPAGLILAAGSLLAGKETGGAGAAAFGLGGLQGLQARETLEREQNAKAIDQLQKQRDEALDRVSAAQQRVNNIFNTNPDAFIDPETGEPTMDPEMLGLLATGFPIRLFPQSRRRLAEATEEREARHKIYGEALEGAETVSDARLLMRAMMRNMKWPDAPDEVVDAMARSVGTPEWTPTVANIIANNATNAPDIFIRAAETGLPLEDYGVISMIQWRDKEAELPSDSDNKLMLIMQFNQWLQQNRDKAAEIRKTSASDPEFLRSAMDEAFAEAPGSAQQLKIFLKVNEDEAMQFFESYDEYAKQHELAASLSGYDELPAIRDMSDEERAKFFARGAVELQGAKKEELLRAQAEQDAAWRNGIKTKLRAEFPALGPRSRANITNEIFKRAAEAATRPDGRLDREKFEAAVQAELVIVRKELQ